MLFQPMRIDGLAVVSAVIVQPDIDISEIKVQETEVVGVQWVNREVLFDMLHSGKLHPLIDYIEEIF